MINWRALLRKNIWTLLALLTLLLRWILGFFPAFTESVYSRGLFLGIRALLDYSIGLLPFPFSYVLALLILAWTGWRLRSWWRKRGNRGSVKSRILGAFRRILSLAGAVVFFFFWLWGFNYQRLPLENALSLELQAPSSEALQAELSRLAAVGKEARKDIASEIPDSLSPELLGPDMEPRVREALRAQLQAFDYPSGASVRARQISPGGWMLRMNIAGIYNPFSGEGNVSTALTPVQIPFTMAHEMAHGYGFGNEGECNFLAGTACLTSRDPVLRYSGAFTLWRYLAYELSKLDADAYAGQYALLDRGMAMDLEAARRNSQLYAGALSKVGEKVNDSYLKAQGVPGGINSYNRVVLAYLAWRRKGNPI